MKRWRPIWTKLSNRATGFVPGFCSHSCCYLEMEPALTNGSSLRLPLVVVGPMVNSKSPPLVVILRNKHHTSLRPPADSAVPWTWLHETHKPGPEDLSGGSDDHSEASLSVHTLCPGEDQHEQAGQPVAGDERVSESLKPCAMRNAAISGRRRFSSIGSSEGPENKNCDLLKTLSGQFRGAGRTVQTTEGSATPSLHTLAPPGSSCEGASPGVAKRLTTKRTKFHCRCTFLPLRRLLGSLTRCALVLGSLRMVAVLGRRVRLVALLGQAASTPLGHRSLSKPLKFAT